MLSVAIDLHRNILSAQCCIKFEVKNTSIDEIQLLCEKSSFSIALLQTEKSKHNIKVLTPNNFFIPSSVSKNNSSFDVIECQNDSVKILQKRKFSIDKNEYKIKDYADLNSFPDETNLKLSVRFQISGSDIICSHSSNEDNFSSLYNFMKSEIIPSDRYKMICTNCGFLISFGYLSFQSVKEHCNTFSDLSESWFCHKNDTPQTVTKLSSDILYIGDAFIYLHSSIFDALHLRNDGTDYKCQECNNVISSGSVVQSFQCISADAVMLTKTDLDQCDYKSFHLKLVLLSLLSMISQKLTACKLFLQSKKEEKDLCLLIWIPPTKIMQFKFQTSTDNMPSEVNFLTEEVYKVQYFVGTLASPPVQKWKKDFSVDFYKVSYNFITTVEDILVSSSKWVYEDKDLISNFSNGYIPSNFKNMY